MSGRSRQWTGIRAYPHVVVVTSYASSTDEPRAVLRAGRRQRAASCGSAPIHGDDGVYVFDDVVVAGRPRRTTGSHGFDPRTGRGKWTRNNPEGRVRATTNAAVYAAFTAGRPGRAGDTSGGAPFARPRTTSDRAWCRSAPTARRG